MDITSEKLVLQYLPLANKLAYQKKRALPDFIDIEELKSAAYMGLVEAASRYDPKVGAAFSTFAYPRIFGAICDYLRELGWGRKHNVMQILSLDAPYAADGDEVYELKDTLAAREDRNDAESLEVIALNLDDQAKQILKHYFFESYSMKEIGEKFNVTESRVSQLIKSYKARIQECWTKEELGAALAA